MAGLRISVVVIGVPHPTDGASSVLFHHYIRCLAEAGHAVRSHVLLDAPAGYGPALAAYEASLVDHDHVLKSHAIGPGLTATARFGLKVDEAAAARIAAAVAEDMPDGVLVFDAEAALCVPAALRPRSVVWLGDLRFDTIWYHWTYGARESARDALRFPYAFVQRRLWQRFYANRLAGMGRLIVASKSSEPALAKLGLACQFQPYPWPSESGGQPLPAEAPPKPRFLFFGHLQGLGSRSSLRFLIDGLYPRLVARWGADGFEVVIGGRHPPASHILAKIEARPGLSYVGFIPDLDVEMARSHAVIAPIDVPVGNRSRILTAMAKGSLVIAHRNVALGNPHLIDGETALLAGDAEGFAERMVWAVERPEMRNRIARHAMQVYQDHYAPAVASPLIVRELENVVAEAVAGRHVIGSQGRVAA